MRESKKKRFSFGKLSMVLGLLLILGAAGLFGYNMWLDSQASLESEQAAMTLADEIQNSDVTVLEMDVTDVGESEEEEPSEELLKVAELDGAYYMGVLTIPTLERILPVQSDWSMTKLKKSPCRYSGSLADGEFVIAGHNYKKHFSGLANLAQGESIIFTDIEGNQTFYEVREIYTVQATDIEGMVNSGYDMSLFTCNYGGKARITVRCDKVDVPVE